jgi:hypothetical protein
VIVRIEAKSPLAAVLDVRTGKVTTTPVPVEEEAALLAVNPRGEVVAGSGTPVAAALRAHEPLMSWDRGLGVSHDGRLVHLSARADGPPLEVWRWTAGALQPAPGDGTLTQVRLAPARMQLAADVVAAARPVDVREPGWAVVADPGTREVASRILAAGVFFLVLAGLAVAAGRRPRPYRRGDDEPPGEAG